MRPGYKRTDVGVIPEEWTLLSVGQIGQVRTGPFGTLLKASEYAANEGVPLISVGEVGDGGFRVTEDTPRVPEDVVRRLPQFVLRTGDIVFGRKGAVDRSALVSRRENGWFLGSDGISLRPLASCHPPYLAAQFRSGTVKSWLVQNAIGTTMASLNQGILSRVLIPCAPLLEQRAIATALSDVDALLGGLDRLIAKKRDLKRAAMQQLLTGQTRLPGFHGEWEVKRLGEVADTDPDNLGTTTSRDFGFNYIALEDVDRGVLQGYSTLMFGRAPSRARRKLRENDVLVSTVRPNLQSHLLFRDRFGEWVCSTGFCVVRSRHGMTAPEYVYAQLFAGSVTRQIDALLTGSNYPAINSGDVRALQIPLPPYEEQTAIAAVLSDMDAELSALEARRDKTRALKQGMMQELLTGRTRLVAPNVLEVEA